jgi:hypothetical protein
MAADPQLVWMGDLLLDKRITKLQAMDPNTRRPQDTAELNQLLDERYYRHPNQKSDVDTLLPVRPQVDRAGVRKLLFQVAGWCVGCLALFGLVIWGLASLASSSPDPAPSNAGSAECSTFAIVMAQADSVGGYGNLTPNGQAYYRQAKYACDHS